MVKLHLLQLSVKARSRILALYFISRDINVDFFAEDNEEVVKKIRNR